MLTDRCIFTNKNTSHTSLNSLEMQQLAMHINSIWASPVARVVKNLAVNAGDIRVVCSIPGSGRFPWRRAWQPTPVFLPGKSHGQKPARL